MNIGDDIDALPADNSQLSPSELAIIHSYLHPVDTPTAPPPDSVKAFTPLQRYLLLFILFVIASLPVVDEYMAEKIPSVYSRIVAKGSIFTLVYFIAMNTK